LQIGDFGKQNAVGKKLMGKQIGTVCSMQRIFVADSADELMLNTHDFLSPFGETNRILPSSALFNHAVCQQYTNLDTTLAK
jgi:hypothetical protein